MDVGWSAKEDIPAEKQHEGQRYQNSIHITLQALVSHIFDHFSRCGKQARTYLQVQTPKDDNKLQLFCLFFQVNPSFQTQ